MKYQKLYFSMLKTFLKSDIKLNILIFLISVSAVFTFISLFCALNSGNAAYHNMMDRSGYCFDGIMPEDSPEFFRENLPEVYTAYADSKAFIAENDCGINIGDRLIIPDDKGDIVLNVIGLSDDFIVPYTFFLYHNNSGIYVKDEDFENEMKNTAPTKYNGAA